MGNCLVTKLKGTVDNQDLLKIGELLFVGYENNNKYVFLKPMDYTPLTIRVKKGLVYASNGWLDPANLPAPIEGSITITSDSDSASLYLPNGSEAVLENYYTVINGMQTGGLTSNVYNYIENLAACCINKGNLSVLQDSTLAKCVIFETYEDVVYDVDILPFITKLTIVKNLMIRTYPFILSATDFATAISDTVTKIVVPYVGLSGSIEEFVAALRLKGRTTGTIDFRQQDSGSPLTFDGEVLNICEDNLVWTADTITFLGKTINA